MELLVTLRNVNSINKFKDLCDGIIVGSYFTSAYNYSLEDLKKLRAYCKVINLKFYVALDNFISENDLSLLYEYVEFLQKLDVDGIYYHDLAVYEVGKYFDIVDKLIYDGQTVLCNSLDTTFYLSKGLKGVCLSRELILDELKTILMSNPGKCDMQIFGHLRMSYSKRKFLSNYFKEINRYYDYLNKQTLYLIEEKRDYKMPILEDSSGTKIYTDYIFQMYKELNILKPYLARGIVDTLFIKDSCVATVLRDYKRISDINSTFLLDVLNKGYPDSYSTGYLYEKTNISKDEKD